MESEQVPGAAHVRNRSNVAPLAERIQRLGRAPTRACIRAGPVAEQNPPLAAVGDGFQHLEIGTDRLHEPAPGPDHARDLFELRDIGEGAGNGAPVGRFVRLEPVGREAERALVDGLADDRGHLAHFVFSRVLGERALAHHVVAHRRVPHQTGDVDPRAEPLDGAQVVGILLPVPGQPAENGILGDVLHGLHHPGQQLAMLRTARCERHAAVADECRGHAVPADRRHVRIPSHLRVQVGVDVDEPGADHLPAGVDLLAPSALDLTDGCYEPVADGDITLNGRCTGTIHDGAATNHDVVHSAPLPADLTRSSYPGLAAALPQMLFG
ncbi:MAG: hypothetical protein R3E86_21215 [Pseudomonadales bacterium]